MVIHFVRLMLAVGVALPWILGMVPATAGGAAVMNQGAREAALAVPS